MFVLYLPFVGTILSIALLPLVIPKLWHLHYGKFAFGWLSFSVINLIVFSGAEGALHVIAHTLLLEYFPFVLLVLALYTISGGLRVQIYAKPTPFVNTVVLLTGALLSSIVGTAGASMILIRPFLHLNQYRGYRTHQVLFFIFVVSNIGGALTPLGDPPLFMGFLKGVGFFWTAEMFWLPYIVTLSVLLTVFFFLDYYLAEPTVKRNKGEKFSFSIDGKLHLLLLVGVVVFVLQSGLWAPSSEFTLLGTIMPLQNIVREVGMLAMAGLSLLLTPMTVRRGHEFHWEPFLEVSKLFLAIFITLIPVIAAIKVWGENLDYTLTPSLYFWMTGLFSAFLDNAPTYLIFFNMAGGDPIELMGVKAYILEAVSLGAVYMGALTYIGNAPNFMVASIARNYGVSMPSFFGYMLWSVGFLLPILLLIDWIFLT